MSLFMTCEEATALLSDLEDGLLSPWQRFKVKLHLLFCPGCRTMAATLHSLPRLVEPLLEPAPDAARQALEKAMARITSHGTARPRPATPVPAEALELLGGEPDPALAILAAAHRTVASARTPEPGPYHLPQGILDKLPPETQWRWIPGVNGKRRAELLQDPVNGRRLILAYSPNGVRSKAHRHLGSESILVLSGSMMDQGLTLGPGDWVHHAQGSVHAPEIMDQPCWCLIREEGRTETPSALDRLRIRLGKG